MVLTTIDLVVREASTLDAPCLAEAQRDHAATPGSLAAGPEEIDEVALARRIERLVGSPNGYARVVLLDDEVVGHAFLEPMTFVSTSHVVHLFLAVHPGHEGRGVGRRLMDDAVRWARRAPGVAKIELRVRETNVRATTLYRSLGFIDEGRLAGRIRTPDGRYLDDLAMGLWVGSPSSRG